MPRIPASQLENAHTHTDLCLLGSQETLYPTASLILQLRVELAAVGLVDELPSPASTSTSFLELCIQTDVSPYHYCSRVLSPGVSSVGRSPKLHRNLARHDASFPRGSEQHCGVPSRCGRFGHADQETLHMTLFIPPGDLFLMVIRPLLPAPIFRSTSKLKIFRAVSTRAVVSGVKKR